MGNVETADMLRAHGLRATPGRVKLLSVLKTAGRPLSQTELLGRLKSESLNRVSIYRALSALVRAGLVHRALVNGRTWAFETSDRCDDRQCHPHFTCRTCGAICCMPHVRVPLATGLPAGYVAKRQKVHIEGICPSCARGGT